MLRGRPDRYAGAIGLGLVLSAVGDFVLPRVFLAGLGSFLGAHVAYTIAFVGEETRLRAWRLLPFAVWLLAAFLWLRPGLGALTVPVAVYMLAIGTMMWRAAARLDGAATAEGARVALAGAVLFGLSDNLLAVEMFKQRLPCAGAAVMTLYWAGQAAIALSVPD